MFTKTGALHADVPSAWDMAAPVPPLYLAWLLMFRGQNRSHAENEQKEGCEEHMRSCFFSFFLDSHPQNVFRQKCVQHFFVLSYLDKCWPPKSCAPTLTNHVVREGSLYLCICTKGWLLLNKAHWGNHGMLQCQQTKCNATLELHIASMYFPGEHWKPNPVFVNILVRAVFRKIPRFLPLIS